MVQIAIAASIAFDSEHKQQDSQYAALRPPPLEINPDDSGAGIEIIADVHGNSSAVTVDGNRTRSDGDAADATGLANAMTVTVLRSSRRGSSSDQSGGDPGERVMSEASPDSSLTHRVIHRARAVAVTVTHNALAWM